MGNCSFKTDLQPDTQHVTSKQIHHLLNTHYFCLVTKNHFISHYVIGKGGFGRVWWV